MGQNEKKPKETDAIKALLQSYKDLQERIDLMESRKECLEMRRGAPSSSNLSGMPGGSGDGSSKQERDYILLEELTEKLDELNAQENRLRDRITDMISLMQRPTQQTVIEMHYIDGEKWGAICFALYKNEPDYEENMERYLKRTFKVHGRALQSLARIYAGR